MLSKEMAAKGIFLWEQEKKRSCDGIQIQRRNFKKFDTIFYRIVSTFFDLSLIMDKRNRRGGREK